MGRLCCVKGCQTRSHEKNGKKINPNERFFWFPTWKRGYGKQVEEITKRRRMAWVAAVSRRGITFDSISPFMRVCSRHFHKGQPAYEMMEADPDWAPCLHLGHTSVTPTDTRHSTWEQLQKETPYAPEMGVHRDAEIGELQKKKGASEPGEEGTAEAGEDDSDSSTEDASHTTAALRDHSYARHLSSVFPARVQQAVMKEENPHEWSFSAEQRGSDLLHIKEEQEDPEDSKAFSIVCVKTEDDDEEASESSQLHQPEPFALFTAGSLTPAAVLQKQVEIKKEEPHGWVSSIKQQNPELLHIKEEPKESQEAEQPSDSENGNTLFFNIVVKSEEEEEDIESSIKVEEPSTSSPFKVIKIESDGELCGGAESFRSHVGITTDGGDSNCSGTDVNGEEDDGKRRSQSVAVTEDNGSGWKERRSRGSDDLRTHAASFYRKGADGPRTRTPPVDSDDSCLSDSGDSGEEYAPESGDESSSDEDADGPHHGPLSISAAATGGKPAAAPKRKRQKVAWRTVKEQNSAKEVPVWQNALPDAGSIRLPIQYFRDFFDAKLLDKIVAQSNLYYKQQNPKRALKLDRTELEQFIGTVVFMSILRLPRSRMYWSSACRVHQVAEVMSRDRWEDIKQFIHFSDNMTPNNDDRLFKIRLVIDSLLPKFQALPQQQMLCVDEQMVPFKGRSALKHIPQNAYKWGYKIFLLCDTKGLVHSFDVYTGKNDPAPGQLDIGASGNIVLKLTQVIHDNVNHLLYFDSWFSSLDLFVALANKGIPALGTVQQSHLHGCSFSADSEMKKKGRGAFEEQQAVVDNVDIRAVKWFDNRGVVVASTFASAQPVSVVLRWDRKLKRNVSVECPSIISLYKEFLGGVGALDALIASHRIHIRSKKYYHRLFFHFVDMAIVNSWLLYQRDCESLGVLKKKQKDLLSFRVSIAQALCMQGKDLMGKKRERPSSDVEEQFERKKRQGPAKPTFAQEVRLDGVGHWPQVENRWKQCKFPNCNSQTVYKCAKCNVHLCLKKTNNCFCEFHK